MHNASLHFGAIGAMAPRDIPVRAGIGGRTAPGLASMLDMNGDGNALDDIMRLAGKVLRQQR
jgi:hypothetical protein